MDLQVEFSISSTAGTPTSASSCCFWLVSQASNWISCWTLSVHTDPDTPAWEQGARLLPCQQSQALASPCSEIQAHRGYVQKLSQSTTESPVHKELLIPPSQGSNRPSQLCITLPYWPVHAGFTHGHFGLSIPSPNSFVLLNKPRRGLGSPGKMKWCELACQRLNRRTSQTNVISTAKSSFTSRRSWTLQVQEEKCPGQLCNSSLPDIRDFQIGSPCVVDLRHREWRCWAVPSIETGSSRQQEEVRWRKDVFLWTTMISAEDFIVHSNDWDGTFFSCWL